LDQDAKPLLPQFYKDALRANHPIDTAYLAWSNSLREIQETLLKEANARTEDGRGG
jgi:hypothetical protein